MAYFLVLWKTYLINHGLKIDVFIQPVFKSLFLHLPGLNDCLNGVFWIFIGGGAGSICRYGIARMLLPVQSSFPYATLLANALSCIVLGFLLVLDRRQFIPDTYKLMLMAGFCGGFSTFSTFTGETYQLFNSGQFGAAFLNIGGSLLLCLLCLFIGMKIAIFVPK